MIINAPYNCQAGIWLKKCPYVDGVYVGDHSCRSCKHFKGYLEKTKSVDVICHVDVNRLIDADKQMLADVFGEVAV